MKEIKMSKFGEFLVNRENGAMAFDVVRHEVSHLLPGEKMFFDFSGVKVLAPSYCDELFGNLESAVPGVIIIDEGINSALKAAFDTVSDIKGVKFTYGRI